MPRVPPGFDTWPARWRDLRDLLQAERDALPDAGLAALGDRPKEASALLAFLKAREAQDDERVRQAIRMFAAERAWPRLEESTQYWLKVRLIAVSHFLELCCDPRPIHPLKTPHAHCSERETLEWLLIDYWKWGRDLWLGLVAQTIQEKRGE